MFRETVSAEHQDEMKQLKKEFNKMKNENKKLKKRCVNVPSMECRDVPQQKCRDVVEEQCLVVEVESGESVPTMECRDVESRVETRVPREVCEDKPVTKYTAVMDSVCRTENEEKCSTSGEVLKCAMCGLGFGSRKALLDHKEEYSLCCRECGLCFATTHEVNQHDREVVHGD